MIPDFESIRFDPKDGSIWYTSEGNRDLGFNPFIFHANSKGDYLSSFLIPKAFSINKNKQLGARQNGSLEGSSFTPGAHFYFTALESPLMQDGPLPSTKQGGNVRLTKYNLFGDIEREYVYPLSPLPKKETPTNPGWNGVTELLAVNDHQLLILERASFPKKGGGTGYSIRLYECDTADATNIHPSTRFQSEKIVPVKKKLVFNFDSLKSTKIGNLEGFAWGPKLQNGDDSLVFISDNHFKSHNDTQLLAFDVSP